MTIEGIYNQKGFFISKEKEDLLNILSESEPGILLVDARALKDTYTCNYMSFLSNKSLFFCLGGSPEDRGILADGREKDVESLLSNTSPSITTNLKKRNIHYIWTTSDTPISTNSALHILYNKNNYLVLTL